MELGYIVSAVRRRLWLIVLFAVLGLLAGLALTGKQTAVDYETRAVLLVQPPSSATGSFSFSNDPDRYVIGQIPVLEGSGLAERVAANIPGETVGSIQHAIRIEHRPKTDVVDVVVVHSDPERAQLIANQYAQQYISDLRTRAASAQAPGLEEVQAQLKALQDTLIALQARISAAVAAEAAAPAANRRGDPEAEALYAVTLNEYSERLQSKIQLETAGHQRVTSEVIADAVRPTVPVTEPRRLFAVAGLMAGLLLGVAGAILVARFSGLVIDRFEFESILGLRLSGEFPYSSTLARSRLSALNKLATRQERMIDRLSVRAEANTVEDRGLIVAVVGTQRGAGTTTLALALASRFADSESNTILVDFDYQDPALTRGFGGFGEGGLPAILSLIDQENERTRPHSAHERSNRIDPTILFADRPKPHLRIVGIGSSDEARVVRRADVSRLLSYVAAEGDVVVVDGGPLFESATAEQLLRLADCVVLAAPAHRLRTSTLDAVGRLIVGRADEVLPVMTHTGRWHLFSRRSRQQAPTRRDRQSGGRDKGRGTSAKAEVNKQAANDDVLTGLSW